LPFEPPLPGVQFGVAYGYLDLTTSSGRATTDSAISIHRLFWHVQRRLAVPSPEGIRSISPDQESALVSLTTDRSVDVDPDCADAKFGARRERRLTLARRVAVLVWALVVGYRTCTGGLAFNRELVLLYIATGLIAASIGRGRKTVMVVRDWLPFALVLLLYDVSRHAATLVGRPTLWQAQVQLERWLFFGTVPTVWLQERIKMPQPPWWEVIISSVYMSFFVVPYVVAGLLWLRNRDDWNAFVRRFIALSFAALIVYVLLPAAPPWAAARCTATDVAAGPSGPACMFRNFAGAPGGGLLGAMHTGQPGANRFIERISTRGWGTLHLQSAGVLIDSGQASVNLVAAIPSLHAALSAMVAAFLWRRLHRRWRPLLAAYVLIMAFALVYSAEHYVIDILLGWVHAAVVLFVIGRLEKRWHRRRQSAVLRQPTGDGSGSLAVEGPVHHVGDVTDVRRSDDVVHRAEPVAVGQRLDVEHVESRRRDPVRPQRRDQSLLVDDRSTRGVD
jgi:membrane-associated phospholipid phosphatase